MRTYALASIANVPSLVHIVFTLRRRVNARQTTTLVSTTVIVTRVTIFATPPRVPQQVLDVTYQFEETSIVNNKSCERK